MSQVGALTCDQTFFFFFKQKGKKDTWSQVIGTQFTLTRMMTSAQVFKRRHCQLTRTIITYQWPFSRQKRIIRLRRVICWIIRVSRVIHLNEKIERIIRLTLSVCFSSNCNGLWRRMIRLTDNPSLVWQRPMFLKSLDGSRWQMCHK